MSILKMNTHQGHGQQDNGRHKVRRRRVHVQSQPRYSQEFITIVAEYFVKECPKRGCDGKPTVLPPVPAPKPAPVTSPVAKPESCPEFACAKCGEILECYVEAEETSAKYIAAKKYIESTSFCPGSKTACGGQQCALSQGRVVYPVSKADPTCPKIGGFKCKAGNSLGTSIGAGLSNWNTYKVCPGATKTSLSCDVKCERGTCGCKFATDMCDKCY